MASNRQIALGRLPDLYGLHPSAFAPAHGCIRLLPFFLTSVGSISGRNRVQPNATVCIQLREITILEFPSVFCRKSSLPYQARGSRAGAVRCPLRSKTSYIT